jgi:hypothetical protein
LASTTLAAGLMGGEGNDAGRKSFPVRDVAAGFEGLRAVDCELPGQDSNLDKESQNLSAVRPKSIPYSTSGDAPSPVAAQLPAEAEIDPELARILKAWPRLPAHIKAAILALVGPAAGPAGKE